MPIQHKYVKPDVFAIGPVTGRKIYRAYLDGNYAQPNSFHFSALRAVDKNIEPDDRDYAEFDIRKTMSWKPFEKDLIQMVQDLADSDEYWSVQFNGEACPCCLGNALRLDFTESRAKSRIVCAECHAKIVPSEEHHAEWLAEHE